jgi:putative transposase
MPRLPRYVCPEYAVFHVTARGAGQIPIYRDDYDRRWFLVLLLDAVQRFSWSCHAFCLMTNHYHLVIEAFRDDMSCGLHRVNGNYAQAFNARHKRWGHLFGERFWCRPVDEDNLETVCLYVMANPVRAKLCKQIPDWPWAACRYDLA